MSTILKALRRLEEEKVQQEAVRLENEVVAPAPAVRTRWPIAVASLAGLLFGTAALVWVLRGPAPQTTSEVASAPSSANVTAPTGGPAERSNARVPGAADRALAAQRPDDTWAAPRDADANRTSRATEGAATAAALAAAETSRSGAGTPSQEEASSPPPIPQRMARSREVPSALDTPEASTLEAPGRGAESSRRDAGGADVPSQPTRSIASTRTATQPPPRVAKTKAEDATADPSRAASTSPRRPAESATNHVAAAVTTPDPGAATPPAVSSPAADTPAEVAAIDRSGPSEALEPRADPQTGELSEPIPRIQRSAIPQIYVTRTTWHPDPTRRQAVVRVDDDKTLLKLREGDAVGPLVVKEIRPSGVLFVGNGVEIQTRIMGAR